MTDIAGTIYVLTPKFGPVSYGAPVQSFASEAEARTTIGRLLANGTFKAGGIALFRVPMAPAVEPFAEEVEINRSGRSLEQMRSAPKGALFVCPRAGARHHFALLALEAGRPDLEIIPPEALEGDGQRYHGRMLRGIVVDHDAKLTRDQLAGAAEIAQRCVR